MKFWILALMTLSYGPCFGQTLEEAEQLFQQHKIADALEMYEKLAKVDATAGAANYMIGKIYTSVKNYNGALPVLQRAIEIDKDRTFVSGWSHAHLGEVYNYLGDYKKQEAELTKAIALNMTENSVVYAQSQLMGLMDEQGRYTQAIALARLLKQKNVANPEPYLVIGNIHKSTGKPDSAVYYLHEAIRLNDDKGWVSGWAHVRLGQTYIFVGDYEDASYELNYAIRLNKTPKSVQLAKELLDSMNYLSPVASPALKKLYAPTWVEIEGASITYKFQDTAGIGHKIEGYIAEHEKAYTTINAIFGATLPKKMTLFVWNDKDLAKIVLGHNLGYTIPRVCVSNVTFDDAPGHEMTHTLCFWGFGVSITNTTRLINEGVAVAFDQSNHDKIDAAVIALGGKKFRSVLDFWKNAEIDEAVFNPVAGAFVDFLCRNSSKTQFKSFVKDQSLTNAENTFGKTQFAQLVSQFDKLVGMK